MCFTLVFPGKIKVDIRFFIPLKSKERFKGNIKAILFQRSPANRAFLIRHITSGPPGKSLHFFRIEIAVMAFLAIVMGA